MQARRPNLKATAGQHEPARLARLREVFHLAASHLCRGAPTPEKRSELAAAITEIRDQAGELVVTWNRVASPVERAAFALGWLQGGGRAGEVIHLVRVCTRGAAA